jgi:hypothetical protein
LIFWALTNFINIGLIRSIQAIMTTNPSGSGVGIGGRALSMIAEGDIDNQLPDLSTNINISRSYSQQSVTSSEPSPAHTNHGGLLHSGHGSDKAETATANNRSHHSRGGSTTSSLANDQHNIDDGFTRIATSADDESPDPLHSGHVAAGSAVHVAFRGRQGSDAEYHAVRLSGSADDFSPFGTHSPSSASDHTERRHSVGDISSGSSSQQRRGPSSRAPSYTPSRSEDNDDHEVAQRMHGHGVHHNSIVDDDDDKGSRAWPRMWHD